MQDVIDGEIITLDQASRELTDIEIERAKRASRKQSAAEASNTARAYGMQMRAWKRWCAENGKQALPANPKDFSDWLNERVDSEAGCSTSTLSISIAAIKFLHANTHGVGAFDVEATWIGVNHETGEPEMTSFRRVWAGIRRSNIAREDKQAAPLKGELLTAIIKHLTRKGATTLDRRDACLISLCYIFALRRSEMAGMDLQSYGDGTVKLVIEDDSATLDFLRSKTNQDGEREETVAMREANIRAFAAIEKWISIADIQPGTPLLRSLTPKKTISTRRITPDGVNQAIKAVVYRYRMSEGDDRATAKAYAAKFSGHSGRVGFIQSAKDAGASDSAVMATTRHAGPAMIHHYDRKGDKKRRVIHHLPGVGL